MCLYKLIWSNPDARTSGAMNNLTAAELTGAFDLARERAGDGEVIMSSMPEDQSEYSF